MLGGNHSSYQEISRRIRACDYLSVAQLFLCNNFLLEEPLRPTDIKPRLLGHWGTCHGINVAYANLKQFFSGDRNFQFILGPGHGFPALQANLFLDGDLAAVDPEASPTASGIAYLCRNFSWPGGFPSHASPLTPGVVCEGGELGYALGAAYGLALGHPEKTIAVLLGDGELETATALDSLNLVKFVGDHHYHGRVLPILHLNGYKISGPTLYGRKSERELAELIRGLGYTPVWIVNDSPEAFQSALHNYFSLHQLAGGFADTAPSAPASPASVVAPASAATPVRSSSSAPVHASAALADHPFFILKTEKGATGPLELNGEKIAGNFRAHQIPLPNAKSNPAELKALSQWLESYHFRELFDPEKGFTL